MESNLEDELCYEDFRTGLMFRAVYEDLNYEQKQVFESEGRRMFITRHTVLGRWHQIKQEMNRDYKKRNYKRY